MDHRGAEPGAVAAVFAVHVLDDLFAPLMLEIHVDVGRLIAFLGKEPLEQQVVHRRVDRGDAEAEADGGVGRRAAPLAEDRRLSFLAGKAHDVVDGQEIAGDLFGGDEREFLLDRLGHRLGHALRVAAGGTLPCQPRQFLHRAAAFGDDLMRVFVGQIGEAKGDPVRQPARLGDGMGPVGEEAQHGLGRFQVPLGIGGQEIARFRHDHAFADRHHHVLQGPPVARVIEHVIGGQNPQPMGAGQCI